VIILFICDVLMMFDMAYMVNEIYFYGLWFESYEVLVLCVTTTYDIH
jgi:hypothetical protein